MKKETKRLLIRGILFVLYLTLGMVVFRQLESHNEQLGIRKAKRAIEDMLVKYNISHQEMKEFVEIITEAESWGFTSGWLEKWSFIGSLFFSGTVITTIGENIFLTDIYKLIAYNLMPWAMKTHFKKKFKLDKSHKVNYTYFMTSRLYHYFIWKRRFLSYYYRV